MKKNVFAKGLYALIAFIQVLIISGVFLVQYLTKKKAGVLRHVYYRKYQYENSIFSPDNISMFKIIAMVTIVFFIVICIFAIKKNNFYKTQTLMGLILSFLLYYVISSNYFMDKVAYHYFIMAFALALVIQIIVVIGVMFLKNDKIS